MRYLILLCIVSVVVAESFAQSTTNIRTTVESRVEAIRQKDLANPKKAKFWRGDSYERLVRLHVLHEMGIDPTSYFTPGALKSGESEPQFAFTDTSVNVSNNTGNQDETTIAINRANKKLVIASANDVAMYSVGMPVYRTTNGGKSWIRPNSSSTNNRTQPPSDYLPLGDPIITASTDGRFYFAYLIANPASTEFTTNIAVARSTDGVNWTTKTVMPEGDEFFFEDKEMVVIDNAPESKTKGRIYVLWNRFTTDAQEATLTLASSSDDGDTWNITEEIAFGTSFPVVRIGPRGEVFAGASSYVYDDQIADYVPVHTLLRSTDGGASFTEVLSISYTDLPTNVDGRPSLKGDFGPRIYPFVSFDIDHKTGFIHLISGHWGGESSQLHYRYSTDGGTSWSQPKIVGIANPASNNEHKDRFFPSVTVDQLTGDAYALYYTSEADDDNIMTTVMRQQLTPDMDKHQIPVAKTPFDPTRVDVGQTGTSFIGDYIGSDAFDSVYAACWTAVKGTLRDGEVFAYIANPVGSGTGDVLPTVINGVNPVISWISPNPSTSSQISVSYFSPEATQITAELYTIEGKHAGTVYSGPVTEGTETLEMHLPAVENGTYFLKVTSPLGVTEAKIIIAR